MTVTDRPVSTALRTPSVEVIVGQDLVGVGLQRLVLLLDDALSLRPVRLLVDLAGTRTLDAAALHVLLSAHTRILRAGGQMTLRSVSGTHARVIALAGLNGVFHVAPEPEPAHERVGAAW